MIKEMNFSGEYVESLSPVERKLMIMYHKEAEKRKATARRQGHNIPVAQQTGKAIDTMVDNYGG